MYELNEKVRSLTPYEPISGKYPVRLDANESFLSLPEELREEIGRAVSRAAFREGHRGVCRFLRHFPFACDGGQRL